MYDRLVGLAVLALLFVQAAGCNRELTEFKQLQQQRSGDYTITVLSDTGVLKQHSAHLRLEFRNSSTNQIAGVSNVQIQTTMRMPGMGPMFGNISGMRQLSPGLYEFEADFSMAGQWNFLVTFDPNGRVQFNVNAQ
jgi:YtkA-like